MKTWSAGDKVNASDLNGNFDTALSYLGTLTWSNASGGQYISTPSDVDEIIMEWEFYNEYAGSNTVQLTVNQIASGYYDMRLQPSGVSTGSGAYAMLASRNSNAGFMAYGCLVIKKALFKSSLIGSGQASVAGGGANGSLGFEVPAAADLSRIDITPSQVVTGNVRFYSRKYS